MPLTGTFNEDSRTIGIQNPLSRRKRRKRPAPFSLRLSPAERARLAVEAAGAPLGAYIKEKVFASGPVRSRRAGIGVEDRQALARALALLGGSRLSSNLNQLAYAVNVGALPVTPETEAELYAAARDVRAIRSLLLTALGLKPEDRP